MKYSLLLIIIIVFLSPLNIPQSKFKIGLSGGYSLNILKPEILQNWNDGLCAGGEFTYSLVSNIDLGLNFNYYYYPFNGRYLQIITPAVVGLSYKIEGTSSDAEEVSICTRFIKTAAFLNSYLIIKTGVYRINIGEVKLWGLNNTSYSRYWSNGISKTNVFASFGYGVIIPFSAGTRLLIEGYFQQVFSEAGITTFPIQAMFQYSL